MKAAEREKAKMELVFKMALAKGAEAVKGCEPTPMVVSERANPLDDASAVKRFWVVNGGVCGFAWVVVKNAGSKAGRFAIQNFGARHSDYERGAMLWPPVELGQSMERKEAWAAAVSRELNENGIDAWYGSRMD